MKRILLLSALFLLAIAGNAIAVICPGPAAGITRLNAGQIGAAFTGNLICAFRPGATDGNGRWSEEHTKAGDLFEFAKGQGDPIDPRRNAGTWQTISNPGKNTDVVRYNYGTGGIFDWSVWEDKSGSPTKYHFCDPVGQLVATTKSTNAIPGPTTSNPCGW